MQDFHNLEVWKVAHQLTLDIYKVTARFSDDERFELTRQLRRAAASIPMNLAEGCGRGSDADFARFVQIATGSASEVEYQLLLAADLRQLDVESYQALNREIVRIRKMLISLLRRLRTSP